MVEFKDKQVQHDYDILCAEEDQLKDELAEVTRKIEAIENDPSNERE
jgi:hypothetical protein